MYYCLPFNFYWRYYCLPPLCFRGKTNSTTFSDSASKDSGLKNKIADETPTVNSDMRSEEEEEYSEDDPYAGDGDSDPDYDPNGNENYQHHGDSDDGDDFEQAEVDIVGTLEQAEEVAIVGTMQDAEVVQEKKSRKRFRKQEQWRYQKELKTPYPENNTILKTATLYLQNL